jgi:hypothetical protein
MKQEQAIDFNPDKFEEERNPMPAGVECDDCEEEPYYCEWCGEEDISCMCCPTNAHFTFDDDECDCMTEDEKCERSAAMVDREIEAEEKEDRMWFASHTQPTQPQADGRQEMLFTADPPPVQPIQEQKYCSCTGNLPPLDKDGKCTGCKLLDKQAYLSNKALPTPVTPQWEDHKHKPTEVIIDREAGWSIWCGKGRDVETRTKGFGLIMNLTGRSIKDNHIIPVPELAKWSSSVQAPEMLMDWPDYGAVELPLEFWQDLAAHIVKNKMKFLVFCVGGHGRTGTAVACLLVVTLNYTADQAIEWVRTNYCKRAIESKSQEEYIAEMYAAKVEQEKQ